MKHCDGLAKSDTLVQMVQCYLYSCVTLMLCYSLVLNLFFYTWINMNENWLIFELRWFYDIKQFKLIFFKLKIQYHNYIECKIKKFREIISLKNVLDRHPWTWKLPVQSWRYWKAFNIIFKKRNRWICFKGIKFKL